MTLPTLARVLHVPELVFGQPQVLAGFDRLDNSVRWVHISELADIAHLLNGGELLLTTGIALPDSPAERAAYVASLAASGASGLVIELGRRFPAAPDELVRAADQHSLPLVALHREVRFVKVTEEAHALIIDSQLDELRARQEIHETFTELALEGASAAEIVRRAARMIGQPLLLADRHRKVLILEAGTEPVASLLAAWADAAAMIEPSGRTQTIGHGPQWLVTLVGARGEIWGHLVLQAPSGGASGRQVTILELAATALALNRLAERDRESLELQSQRSLLAEILSGAQPAEEVEARARAFGVELSGRTLVGSVVKVEFDGHEEALKRESLNWEMTRRLAVAARQASAPALIGVLAPGTAGALLSYPVTADTDAALARFAGAVRGAYLDLDVRGPVVAAGSAATSIPEVRRSFKDALGVADSVGEGPRKLLYRLPDVHLRGLLHMLRDDRHLQAFCERELGALLGANRRRAARLFPVLQSYLENGCNKSATAAALGLSRPALYARLAEIEALLGVDLGSPESSLSLHVALLGLQLGRTRGEYAT